MTVRQARLRSSRSAALGARHGAPTWWKDGLLGSRAKCRVRGIRGRDGLWGPAALHLQMAYMYIRTVWYKIVFKNDTPKHINTLSWENNIQKLCSLFEISKTPVFSLTMVRWPNTRGPVKYQSNWSRWLVHSVEKHPSCISFAVRTSVADGPVK